MSIVQESVRASWTRLDEKMIKFMNAHGIRSIHYSQDLHLLTTCSVRESPDMAEGFQFRM